MKTKRGVRFTFSGHTLEQVKRYNQWKKFFTILYCEDDTEN